MVVPFSTKTTSTARFPSSGCIPVLASSEGGNHLTRDILLQLESNNRQRPSSIKTARIDGFIC